MAYKIGINSDAYNACSDVEAIPVIKSVGFDSFFMSWKGTAYVERCANAAARSSLIFQSIHAPFENVNEIWHGSELGGKIAETLKSCIDDCVRFDVPLMIIHPFIGFKEHTPTEAGLRTYGDIIDYSDKKGVLLGFENVEGDEYLAAIMERYADAPTVKFCWDTGHELCYNRGKDQMALYGDKCVGTHFDDNMGCTDPQNIFWTDDLHMLPFDGIVDWQGVMDRIRAHGYTDVLTFELTTLGKPEKEHYHRKYAEMTCEEFFGEAAERARRVAAL